MYVTTHKPDKWVVLQMNNKGEIFYKVLAGWSGSYLYGQSWQLNSGIVKVEIEDDYYLFHGYSGSIYKCHKDGYGLNNMTASILANLQKKAEYLQKKAESTQDVEVIMLEDQDFTQINYQNN